ncbi:cytochrome c biogenesis protein ResB [Ectothiorhodospiraceae bacterium 2226]|nr:cytochrome c biogenesis protein ResB [Ectothiorhodospiraceae bacterium 2226]
MSSSISRPRKTTGKVLLEFLGSMNLAITLLVALAIASIIGTVLQQNLPYPEYVMQFGPYWFELFERLGLYDVYSAWWFMIILGFLLVSTSVCVYRNAPGMLREMRQFRTRTQERSLRALRNSHEWRGRGEPEAVVAAAREALTQDGYRVRSKAEPDRHLVAGMRGASNRLGYLFTHLAIVVICIGGLIDGNIGLKFKEMSGRLQVETRDILARDVPAESRLAAGESSAFRGNVTIPEGARAGLVFLNIRDGYVIQELPFDIEVKEFRIRRYPNGEPSSYESDLVIHDPQLDEPLHRTIKVNHPLIHRGYAIYQASFADGGSRVAMNVVPLSGTGEPAPIEGRVERDPIPLQTSAGQVRVELVDFQPLNVFPVQEGRGIQRDFVDFGPSVVFRLRDARGMAREYLNYVNPVEQDGRLFFLSGVRSEIPGDEFRYLHLPVGPDGTLDRFLSYRARLGNPAQVADIAEQHARSTIAAANMTDLSVLDNITASMTRLVGLFNSGGFDAVVNFVRETVPEERHEDVTNAYFKVLESILQAVYLDVLDDEGVDLRAGVPEAEAWFFEDAVNAITALSRYGADVYMQVTDYEHREATGLQIARAPGQNIVYFGSLMLIVGIFLMFYVAHRRVWLLVRRQGDGEVSVLLAGSDNRHQREFAREFERLRQRVDARLTDLVGPAEETTRNPGQPAPHTAPRTPERTE